VDLVRITQQDIADLMGASRAMVSTLINQLKVRGVLANAGRILCVRDLDALRTLASSEGSAWRGR
jgi:CRP-like cAMP-binding protein